MLFGMEPGSCIIAVQRLCIAIISHAIGIITGLGGGIITTTIRNIGIIPGITVTGFSRQGYQQPEIGQPGVAGKRKSPACQSGALLFFKTKN